MRPLNYYQGAQAAHPSRSSDDYKELLVVCRHQPEVRGQIHYATSARWLQDSATRPSDMEHWVSDRHKTLMKDDGNAGVLLP